MKPWKWFKRHKSPDYLEWSRAVGEMVRIREAMDAQDRKLLENVGTQENHVGTHEK